MTWRARRRSRRGSARGTLGTIVVPPTAPTAPGDFGLLFPAAASKGIGGSVSLPPGQWATENIFLSAPGEYNLETTFQWGAPTIFASVGGKALTLAAGAAGQTVAHLLNLPAGLITLVTTGGQGGSLVQFRLHESRSGLEDLLNNGVGQATALGLRLITPTPIVPGAAPGGLSSDVGPTAIESVQAPAPATPFAGNPGPVSRGVTSLADLSFASSTSSRSGLVGVATIAPVGHPSAESAAIAAVGPVVPGGQTALASSLPGIPPVIARLGSARDRVARSRTLDEVATAALTADADAGAGDPASNFPPALPPAPGDRTVTAPMPVRLASAMEWMAAYLADALQRTPDATLSSAGFDDVALSQLEVATDAAAESAEMGQPASAPAYAVGATLLAIAASQAHARIGRRLGRPRFGSPFYGLRDPLKAG